MSELGVFVYCAAMGFVTAATIASFYQWVTAEHADFKFVRLGVFGLAAQVLISTFGGPFIVMRKVLTGVRAREISAVPAMLGVAVAAMWSVCAGIFYVGLLVSV